MNLLNRAKVVTGTTGTGTITLGAAVVPYQTWANAGAIDQLIYSYLIEDGNDWELGIGIYTASGTTLTRSVTQSQIAGVTGTTLLTLSGAATVACAARREDMANVFTRFVCVGGETTKTFSNIPAMPGDLELIVMGRGTTAAVNRSYSITVNGSSSAIYSAQRIYATTTSISADQTLGNTKWGDGNVAGASAPAGIAGFTRLRIFNYADTTFYKMAEYTQRTSAAASDQGYHMTGNIQFDTTAAISSITVTIDANAWVAGSIFTLRILP